MDFNSAFESYIVPYLFSVKQSAHRGLPIRECIFIIYLKHGSVILLDGVPCIDHYLVSTCENA